MVRGGDVIKETGQSSKGLSRRRGAYNMWKKTKIRTKVVLYDRVN